MTAGWVQILGSPDAALEQQLADRVAARVAAKEFTRDNIAYINKVTFQPVSTDAEIPAERLERLRRLCQLWDVRLLPAPITSHRPVIGKVIVFAKRLLFPILKAFFKDTLHQQRSFNAASVALLSELVAEVEALSQRPR